jgi:hypothetical protein
MVPEPAPSKQTFYRIHGGEAAESSEPSQLCAQLYAAMRAMDGLEQRKEEMRDMRRIHWLTDFLDDVQPRRPEPAPHARTAASSAARFS